MKKIQIVRVTILLKRMRQLNCKIKLHLWFTQFSSESPFLAKYVYTSNLPLVLSCTTFTV